MFEMIVFAVVLGITLILGSIITGVIVMALFSNEKFLKKYVTKFTKTYISVIENVVSGEEDDNLKEVKRKIFEDVDNFEEA